MRIRSRLKLRILLLVSVRQPVVTGTSVLGLLYKDGIMMAADNLGTEYMSRSKMNSTVHDFSASYGSLARFKDIKRLYPVGNNTVIGAGGDISDFQYIQKLLDELMNDEFTQQDGHTLGPVEIHEYLSQVMYARRTKMNPLWNSLVVGGFKDGNRCVLCSEMRLWDSKTPRFLAYVDLLGTTYKATTIATGYGAYIAQPLLRKAVEPYADVLKEEQAQKILEDCMRVLFYRDARSLNKASTLVTFIPLLSHAQAL